MQLEVQQKAVTVKEKIDKWDSMKIKNFSSSKDIIIRKQKGKPRTRDNTHNANIWQTCHVWNDKELPQISKKEPIKMEEMTWAGTSQKRNSKWPGKYIKRCLLIKKIQIKTTMRNY